MSQFIKIHPSDNVIITLRAYHEGEKVLVDGNEVMIKSDVPSGHKIALKRIDQGANVIKYGFPIGHASTTIEIGEHAHVHNIKTNLGENESYTYKPIEAKVTTALPEKKIQVYKRSNGEIGIRNELWIVPTVGCVNGIAKEIIKEFEMDHDLEAIDGVFAFTHPYGCSQMGDDHINTKETLQNIVRHPNAGGVLVLGLGCENNQIEAFKASLGEYDRDRVKFLVTQEVEDEVETGSRLLSEIYDIMSKDMRTEEDFSKLRIGLECGGSDGLSGITANPLLGVFSDYIIHYGGTTVLTEVPEMFGAESILMDRCKTETLFDHTVEMVQSFKQYYRDHGQVIYENPSPGNKRVASQPWKTSPWDVFENQVTVWYLMY